MKKKTKYRRFVALSLIVIGLGSINSQVNAKEARTVETEGTIHFTGIWVDPNQPIPSPPKAEDPEYEAKPPAGGHRLPQTNTSSQTIWFWLGIIISIFALITWRNQNKKQKLNGKKVGTIR